MDITTIRCYISPRGENLIEQWFKAQEDHVQAEFSGALAMMRARPYHLWAGELCKGLEDRPESKCAGLSEIKLDVGRGRKKHYRIIGFRGPRESDFTMLVPFLKNEDASYKLPCDQGQERKNHVTTNWQYSTECEFA